MVAMLLGLPGRFFFSLPGWVALLLGRESAWLGGKTHQILRQLADDRGCHTIAAGRLPTAQVTSNRAYNGKQENNR